MASSVSAPVVVPQATKRTHAEMSNSEISSQESQSSLQAEESNTSSVPGSKIVEVKTLTEPRSAGNLVSRPSTKDSALMNSNASNDTHLKENITAVSSENPSLDISGTFKQKPCDAVKTTSETLNSVSKSTDEENGSVDVQTFNGSSTDQPSPVTILDIKEAKKAEDALHGSINNNVAANSQLTLEGTVAEAGGSAKCTIEPVKVPESTENQDVTANANLDTALSPAKPATNKNSTNNKSSSSKQPLEDGEEPEKKAKIVSSSKSGGKSAEQILEYMDKTFEQRRKIITKQMPSIPELKELYPDLFMGKQLLIEFQRITKIDIDQKIQEFCVRYATAVIEMAKNKKEAAPVLARWEQAKQENDTLRQYWDMVTALCLLPLHFGENFVEMVLEIGEEEEVVAQGKIVPTLVARGNIFRTDEFFLIAENTIVQEFEEFTIAFASLYSSYWVFNMVYPETIENTYNYIQRCIVRQREPGSIPTPCKNFTKALLKWNKGKEGK